jgi:hypothetical protein
MFPSSGDARKTSTLFGPLESDNLNFWTALSPAVGPVLGLALSKGSYRVDFFLPSPEEGNRFSFRNVVFYSF